MEDKPRVYQRMRNQYWGQMTEDEVRESIAHYWGYCSMEDQMFGEVLHVLDATGQAENTLVLFMSDHGDYAGAHGLYCKGVPSFREAVNIPTIARWPAGIKNPGREVGEFVTLADFAPTFLELCGCRAPEGLTGRSIAPFLRDETPSDWPDAYYGQMNGVELYYTQRVVQTKEWKYVYNGFDFDELYDLKNDPHEMVNLAFPSRYPQTRVHAEVRRTTRTHEPWPRLTPELEKVRRELVRKMWRFARREKDITFNSYATVALAPYGPADAFGSQEQD
jgi:arylsulfatase A-like enzyme